MVELEDTIALEAIAEKRESANLSEGIVEGGINMEWVTSDHHFGHERIIGLERPQFKSLVDMNNYMITQWNKVVAPEDTVYHLGDFSLGLTNQQMGSLMNTLNGTIILVRGNHDRMGKQRLLDFGFKDVVSRVEMGRFILTHRPIPKDLLGDRFNIHGHIHSNNIGHDNYINVSVEQTDYTPVRLDTYIKGEK